MVAGVGEAGARYLAQTLYGTEEAEKLTESQKQQISTLSQLAAGFAS
ncbi:VENN motif pre-toxin domain-containing protein [Rodentibacter caecimuris]